MAMKYLSEKAKQKRINRDKLYVKKKIARKFGLTSRNSIIEAEHISPVQHFANTISKNYQPVVWRAGYLCISAPPDASIARNPYDFYEFVSLIRYWAKRHRSKKLSQQLSTMYKVRMPVRNANVAIDFGSTTKMSFAFALVLVAELSFIFEKRKNNFLDYELASKWQPDVYRTLHDIGFFEYFEVENAESLAEAGSDVKTLSVNKMPVFEEESGEQVDSGKATKVFMQQLEEAFNFSAGNESLADAIAEALINIKYHAYDGRGANHYCCVLGGQKEKTLRLFVYDKGQGIPESMKQSQSKWNFMANDLHKLSDVELVKIAMGGRSRTQQTFRGLGLPAILNSVKTERDAKNSCREFINCPH